MMSHTLGPDEVASAPPWTPEGGVRMTAPDRRSEDVTPLVTLFESYGAGATQVGRAVAEALGLPFHEQAFSSDELAGTAEGGLDERAALVRVLTTLGGAYGGFEGRDVVTTQQEKYDLVMENNEVVWRYADEGGVIVGRNAPVILAGRPQTLHVLLTGEREERIARAAEDHGLSLDEARRRQEREDDVRVQMSKVLYGWDPSSPERYDMMINTTRIPRDAVVEAIVDAIQVMAR